MDSFVFDLQLFAVPAKNEIEVTIDLSDTKLSNLTTGTAYLLESGWTTEAPQSDAAGTIKAMLVDGTLSVKATDGNDVLIKDATAAQMQGVSVEYGTVFAYDGETSAFKLTRGDEGTKVNMYFDGDTLKHLELTNVSMEKGEVAFDATTACKVTVPTGATLTVPSPVKEKETVKLAVTKGDLTVLSTGTGKDVVISGFDDGDAGTLTDSAAAETAELTAAVSGETVNFAVTGDVVGHWVGLNKASAALTILAEDTTDIGSKGNKVFTHTDTEQKKTVAVDAVDFPGYDAETEKFAAGTLTLKATTQAKPTYYTVTYKNGAYNVADGNTDDPKYTSGDVGYFKLTVTDTVNQPTAVLEFYAYNSKGQGAKAKILSRLPINALALDNITLETKDTATLKGLTVSGVTMWENDVRVYNLAPTATLTGGGKDSIVSYAPTYAVGGASIVLDEKLTADTTYFYEITPTKTTAEDGKHSTVTYTLGEKKVVSGDTTLPAAKSKAYYKVEYTANTNTYAVSYVDNDATGDNAVDMTKSCWANVAIDGSNLPISKTVSENPVGTVVTIAGAGDEKADTYNISAICGVDVKAANATTRGTISRGESDVVAALTSETGDVNKISLNSSNKFYQVVIKNDGNTLGTASNTGARSVSIKEAVGSAPDAPYFQIVEKGNTITLEYVNTEEGKRLADLIGTDGKAFRIAVDASGIGTGKTVVITDGATGASTNVDYAVTGLPAGTEVTNSATSNDTLRYDPAFVANVSFALDTVVKIPEANGDKSMYCLVEATPSAEADIQKAKGIRTVALSGNWLESNGDLSGKSYFEVKASKSGDTTTYAVYYHVGTGENEINLKAATGKVDVSAAGVEVTNIKLYTNLAKDDGGTIASTVYNLTNVDENNPPATDANITTVVINNVDDEKGTELPSAQKSYKDYYALTGDTTITLNGKQEKTYYVVTTDTTKGTHTVKIANAAGVTSDPGDATSYFLATVADGKVTLTFHEGTDTDATKKAEINGLAAADKFIVNAAGVGDEVTGIVLTTDSSDLTANYSVTNIPKTVTSIAGKGTNDEIAYTKSYVLGEANTISLTATAGTVYYAVTATGGKDDTTDRGIYTCSIGTTALKEAPKSGSYFTVTTGANSVDIVYTAGDLPFTTVDNVAIDASNAPTLDTGDVTITLSNSGSKVKKYEVTGLTKSQTVTKGTNNTDKPALTYVGSYNISGDITLNKTTDSVTEYPTEVYYIVTQTKDGSSDTTNRGITEYTVAKGSLSTNKHYFKVSYDSQWNVSVIYVNADSDPAYDLSDTDIGRVVVNASALKTQDVDTINFTGVDQANYEITGVAKSTMKVNGTGTNDVINYDADAALASDASIDLATLAATDGAGVEYYLVAGKVSGKTTDIENCTVTKTTADKITDASNYFTVTKDAEGNYTVAYTTAKSGDALNLRADTSTLTVANASKIASGKGITVSNSSVTAAMTELQGGVTITDTTNKATATYKTTFAWAEGVYYIPVASKATSAEIKPGVVATTEAGSSQLYAVVTVKATEGVYTATVGDKVISTSDPRGVIVTGDDYDNKEKSIITLPSTTGFKFDAANKALTSILGVSAGAVLTKVNTATTVTTAALASGASFDVTLNGGSSATTYKSGADSNTISVKNGAIASGVLVLDAAMENALSTTSETITAGQWKSVKVVTVPQSSDGVVITVDAETHLITGITGLEKGEVVQVTDGAGKTYQYAYTDDGKYIEKYDVAGKSTVGKTAATVGDIIGSDVVYSTGEKVQVGKFVWTNGTYYVAATAADGAANLTYTAASTGTAEKGTYYVEAKLTDGTLELTPYVGAGEGLINKTTAFTGTVNIAAPEIPFTYDKASNKTFKLNVTGAMTGSSFENLVAGDQVTSAKDASIKMDNVTYAATAGSTLTFVGAEGGARLQAGTLITGTGKLKLSGSSTVQASTVKASADATIVVANGKLESLKDLTGTETFTVTTDTSEKVYTSFDDGATITLVETITATGEVTTTTYKPATPGGEVLNLDPVTTAGSVTSNFDWSDSAKNVGYIAISDASGTVAIDNSTKSGPQPFTKTSLGFIKLEKSYDAKTGVNTVTVTPMAVGSDGVSLVEDTTGRFMGTVTIAASSTPAEAKLKYDGTAKGENYKVAFTDVASGSVFDNLAKGDKVTSVAFTLATATVEANGVTFTSGTTDSNTIELYSDGKTAHIVSGTIKATGIVTASNNGVDEETLVYDKGTSKGTEGVIVAYTGGASGAITGLDEGETVTVTKSDGSTEEYYAKSGAVFYQTKTTAAGVTTIGAFSSGTSSLDITKQTYEPVVDGTDAATLTFDWGKTTGKNVSYSLIGGTPKGASVAAGTTTLTYENYGKTYLVGTYDTGTNEITFKKAAVLATGKLDTAQNLVSSDVTSLTIDAAKNTIKYTKDNIADVTVTNAGAGSTFTSFTAAEVAVTSTALTAGDTITIGSAVYTAGADNDVLVIEKGDTKNGNKVVSGSYKLVETANKNKIYTYAQDSTTKTTTTSTVTCNTGTSGAIVEVSEGIVGAVKGLDTASEKVTVATVVAEKDGTTTTTETVYTVTAAAEKKYTVEKQETVNGVKTVYTQTFTSATQDVTTTTGWKTSEVTTEGTFDWGGVAASSTPVGYWLMTKDANNVYTVDTTATSPSGVIATGKTYDIKKGSKGVYLCIDSEKKLDGSFVVNSIKLMEVQENGSLKEITGTLGAITITAPTTGNLTLPTDHTGTFTVEATESMSYVVGANDMVKVEFDALADKVIVNGTTYNSGVSSKKDMLINGDGSVKDATLTVGSTELTDVKGNKVKATVGDAVVVFDPSDGINSIKLDTKEDSVTYTDADGVITVYTAGTSDAKEITKTITAADGVIETWKKTLSNVGDEVMTGGYGIDSRFDWGEETGKSFGYFAIGDSITTQTSGTVKPDGTGWYVRVVATKDAKGVYKITSLKRFQDTASGLVEKAANDSTTTAVKITAPGSLTLDSGAITLVDGDGKAITRNYDIEVSGATAGGVYTGFAAGDTITASLAANDTITVNSKKYQVWNPGSAQFYGTGEAIKGAFDISSTYKSVSMMTAATGGASTVVEFSKGDGARLLVSGGQLSKITNFNTNGESIKVTETTAAGVVTVTTYTAATKDGITTVTKEVVADGSTKKYTGTLDNDVLAIDDWTDTGDVTTTSKFDWTAAGGPGFFAVTPTTTKDSAGVVHITALGTADVAAQTTKLSITKANKGKYYLKVSLSADNTVSGAALYTVESNGALTAVDTTGLTGTVNITAPAEALTYANIVNVAGIAVNITGAAATSDITLKKGDTLTTATLAAPVTTGTPPTTTYANIKVSDGKNSNTYKAGAKGVLTFSMDDTDVATGEAIVVTSGTLALEQGNSFKAAGAASTSATDNVNVEMSKTTGDAAKVTVAGGLVTGVAISKGTVTTTSDAATVAYSLNGKALEANITTHTSGKTFTLATLGDGEVVKVSGTATYTSGAAANTITLSDEGGALTVLDGVLKMASGTTITLAGTSAATDKITATFTAAAGSTSTPILTVENGVVKSVTDLGKGTSAGDKLVVVDTTQAKKTITTTYQLSATGTTVTKTEVTNDSSTTPATETTKTYTAYIAAGSDLMAASYISGDGSGDTLTEKPVVGQFSWNTISGRATGYFKIGSAAKNSTNVVEQPSEVALAKSASKTVPQRYVVGTVSDAEGTSLEDGVTDVTRRQLALGVLQVDNNGVLKTEGVSLTAADTINIAAPTTPIAYAKDGAFHAVFTKVAAESTFTNLAAGDKVTTASLTAGNIVAFDGKNYVAGANGALTFIGQTTTSGEPAVTTYNTALLNGTVKLTAKESAVLAGATATEAATASNANDVTVTVNNTADTVIVKVANGKVSSITGVKTAGTTVTVAVGGDKTYVYEAVDGDGSTGSTMFRLTSDDGANYTYKNFSASAAGANFYSEGGTAYKALATTKVTKMDWTKAAAFNTYVTLPDNLPTDTSGVSISKSSTAVAVKDFQSLPTKYYLNLKGSTAVSKGLNVVKVTGLSLMQADGSGALKAVNAKATTQYRGTVTVNTSDEAVAPATVTYAGLEYTLPTANRTWKLAGTVGVNSTIKNLADGDLIDTGNGTFKFGTNGTAFNIYKAGTNGTEVTTITSSGIDTDAVATVTGQALASVTGMTKGTLTIVKNTEASGLVTTVYQWKKVSGVNTLYRTVTAADGTVTVNTMTKAGTDDNILHSDDGGDATYTANAATAINSVFDWTLDKAATGYFKVTGTTAAAKGITTKITDTKKDANTYIKLTLNTADKTDAKVSGTGATVEAVKFDASTGKEVASTFSGKLTVTGPKTALTFDRGAFDASMNGTTLAFTNIVSGSDITGLVANDKVTTASFAKPTTTAGVMNAASTIKLGGLTFSAGAAGTMEFTVQNINTDDPHYTLTKGNALLDSNNADTEGKSYLYAGMTKVEAKANAGGRSQITVTASTTTRGTTFTVGGISENEQFVVTNKDWAVSGNEVTFTRSGSTLFCTYQTEAGEDVTKAYTKLGAAADASITSANLDKAVNALPTDKTWVTLAKTFYTADGNSEKSKYYGSFTVDLAKMTTRYTADTKAGTASATYKYVVDTYLSDQTGTSTTKALAAAVVKTQDMNWQTLIGSVDITKYTYSAATLNIGQTIKAAKDWNVTGSEQADIITGASANSVVNKVQNRTTIEGGAGNDTITGGGATEEFTFDLITNDNDVLKSYATGKDTITTGGKFDLENVVLAGTGFDTNGRTKLTGVLLHDGSYDATTGDANHSVLLVGVAGKAVEIDGTTYYFGDGTKTRGAATFTYAEGARYYANDALTNTLKVTTDKTKATKTTLGDTVSIDLLSNASDYINIDAIDASASGNSLILTAAEKGSTLKGGSYQTTLRGGAGNDVLQGGGGADVFSFKGGFGGSDTIKSYVSGKDAVYVGLLGDSGNLASEGVEISASGTAVVLKQGTNGTVTIENAAGPTKALSISKDGTSTNTLSYYVAATAPKANTFTAKVGTDVTVTTTGTSAANYNTTVSMKSYYIGNDSATDTLKITGKSIGAAGDNGSAVFDLSSTNTNLTSIDVLDTTGVTGTKTAMSYIKLKGKAEGTFTLTGSTNAYTTETFDMTKVDGTSVAKATVKNLGVGDVIELAAGATASVVKNVATLTWSNGSTITLTGIKDFGTAFTAQGGATLNAGGTFKRTK